MQNTVSVSEFEALQKLLSEKMEAYEQYKQDESVQADIQFEDDLFELMRVHGKTGKEVIGIVKKL